MQATVELVEIVDSGRAVAKTANRKSRLEQQFARGVQAHGRPGDVVVALSTSGNSENVNAGVREARERGLRTIALTGRGGGKLAALADVAVVVPSDSTARIQEAHITALHVLCELVDEAFGPDA